MFTLKHSSKNPSVYHLPLERPMFRMQLFAHNNQVNHIFSLLWGKIFLPAIYRRWLPFQNRWEKMKVRRFVCVCCWLLGQFHGPPCWDGNRRTQWWPLCPRTPHTSACSTACWGTRTMGTPRQGGDTALQPTKHRAAWKAGAQCRAGIVRGKAGG